MTLYQIVDDTDTLTGLKERQKIDPKVDCYRASALWLTHVNGQILIAKRHSMKDTYPGIWGPAVAGTLEEGETYETNMYKEAMEEIGLTNTELMLGPKMKFESPRKHFTQWFLGTCDWSIADFTLQPTEVEKVAWISVNDLLEDVRMYPSKYVPSMPHILNALYKTTL